MPKSLIRILIVALTAFISYTLLSKQGYQQSLQNIPSPVATALAEESVRTSKQHSFRIVPVTGGLVNPWGLAFLPNGDMLVTERPGRLRMIRDGKLLTEPISGLPKNIYASGQGGLLDVALHPDFKKNRWVYISYAGRGDKRANTEVARGKLKGMRLTNLEVIFRAQEKTGGNLHYGSRLLFLPDGTLMITLGDRYLKMKQAQSPADHFGTIVRVNDDGSIPDDNPFVGQSNARPEVYSYGHRNVQGIDWNPVDGTIWAHEHGPKGGDEVNIIKPGLNYGWPVITYGIDYSGRIISDKTHMDGMEQPAIYWDPSIAPCGMAFYNGDQFPNWKGDLFVGALAHTHLRRLEIEGSKVVEEEVLFHDLGRIRDVRSAPDGAIYVLIDSRDGGIYRLEARFSHSENRPGKQ